MEELKNLTQGNMLRRTKDEVLDLPPKIRNTIYVENTKYQQKLYDTVQQEILDDRANIVQSVNPLSKLMRLRQVNGSPEIVDLDLVVDDKYPTVNSKITALIDLVKTILERNEKMIIYSNWVEPLRVIYKFLDKLCKCAVYTGTLTQQERQHQKRLFKTDKKYKIIMGTYAALGTTHTLTEATNVIFYDECWTPSDKVQAEDRAYRIGTSKSINIYTIITKDTVDERVHNILYNKEQISGYLIDNQLDFKKNPKLFDILLGLDNKSKTKSKKFA